MAADRYFAHGWEQYFTELTSFVGDLSRHEGTTNENYTEFAIDRIEMCIVNLSSFIHHLEVAVVAVGDEEQGTIRRYLSLLSDLKELMIIILR